MDANKTPVTRVPARKITKSGKLHGSIKCVECGGKRDDAGHNPVKIDLDGKPRHSLCTAPFRAVGVVNRPCSFRCVECGEDLPTDTDCPACLERERSR